MTFCFLLAVTLSQFGFLSMRQQLASQTLNSGQRELAVQLTSVTKDYLEKRIGYTGFHGKSFCAYRVLEIEQQGTTIKEYVYSLCQEYYLEDGELKQGSGGSEPVALYIQQQEGNHYTIIKHETAADGDPWRDDVKRIFPKKTHYEIFSFEPHLLKRDTEVEAKKYFGKQGRLSRPHRRERLEGKICA